MFSKACEYGIKASIYITEQSLHDRKVSLKDVAKAIKSPEAYTSKILQQLVRTHIINSDKGPTGGFSIEKQKLDKITLSAIVFAIDGDDIYKGCGLGLSKCNEKKPCSVHNQFKQIRENLKNMLEQTTLKALAIDLENGLTFLKR
ncbi:MAG: Rrf2 family transcriptional regulator [Bacteroidia bacterium]|nr:Rrf2 family transcriptional regulator [Bacteroidia bacterium]